MSSKSHPGDGTRGQGPKGGDITNVAHPPQGVLGLHIVKALRNLWQMFKR